MTAVVAIMNKTGVALAADSAVTIGSNSSDYKVYNTANKLFALSKYHPIGIMIYNQDSFLKTPWEIIIKLYKKKLGNKSFLTVSEYADDFMKFLAEDSLLNFINKESENDFIINLAKKIIDENIFNISASGHDEISILQALDEKISQKSSEINQSVKIAKFSNADYIIPNISTNAIEEISSHFYPTIITSFPTIDVQQLDILFEKFKRLLSDYLTRQIFEHLYSGLVFVGYGESQIYPAITSNFIEGIFDEVIRYSTSSGQISNSFPCNIYPFAQTDVMENFLNGIDLKLRSTIISSLEDSIARSLEVYNESIKSNLNLDINNTNIEEIKLTTISQVIEDVQENIDNMIKSHHVYPTLNAINALSKEYLAELAESLIYLTFLKRRTSLSLESVGGDIDVAIISKGDGFIWKKRKHYFDKDLNLSFFQNYFNQ